ncbi:glycoside hydrolase superfamily [Scheffersomyces coipomensis]|uniref:glycoside hydrolase superfamily n=1 Tax=Scheffersomyces coipomensis TaxID=1788519 RepID=UPI00315C4DCC
MFDKLRLKEKGGKIKPSGPSVKPGQPPSAREIYQSRRNYGVNIGSCFIQEKWIFHDLFHGNASCELELAETLSKELGNDQTRSKLEEFWSNFMNGDDWNWLQEHEVTSVRVPLGYWNIGGGRFAKDTKFEKYATKLYTNSWTIFKSKFIEEAAKHGISVVVDLHGLPFGANGADHSGEQSSGKAGFWDNESAQLKMLDLFSFIAEDLKGYDNIAAIQIVNESEFANDPASKQTTYYSAVINSIREKDSTVPVVISDGWWPDQWVKWVQKNQDGRNAGVVIDSHCYRCFSDADKNKSPRQIIKDLNNDLLTNLSAEGIDFMIGEYSCVLDGSSWNKDNAQNDRDNLVIEYGRRQTSLIHERVSFGSYFWTFKFQSGNGGEWDFKTMTDKGAISRPFSLKGKQLPDKSVFDQKLDNSFNTHCNYWNSANPNENYEHKRYKEGFITGWSDAQKFAEFNGSTIGRIKPWKNSRLNEHLSARGNSKFIWEWEQGFDTGIKEYLNSV